MSEETGITVVGALAIAGVMALVIFILWYLSQQQNRRPQPGQSQEPSSPQ